MIVLVREIDSVEVGLTNARTLDIAINDARGPHREVKE